jgi:hypothetical protein
MALKYEYDWLFIMTVTKNTSTRSISYDRH